MRKTFLPWLICLLAIPAISSGQDYPARFAKLAEANDTTGQLNLLKKWSAEKPSDPELFIAWFNHYVFTSRHEVVSLNMGSGGNNGYTITDSSGNTVGSLGSSVKYREEPLKKGLSYIDKGIALYPDRLDMRFGKIYMLGETEDYTSFTSEIVRAIEYAQTIHYKWKWKAGEPLEDSLEFFLGSIQGYVGKLYDTEDDALLPNMRQISETVLKYHPNHVESLSNIAITYVLTGDYDKGLTYLLRAEKVNPKDMIVLNNIAECYKRKGDKANAIIYLKKIIQNGDADEAESARQRLKELQ